MNKNKLILSALMALASMTVFCQGTIHKGEQNMSFSVGFSYINQEPFINGMSQGDASATELSASLGYTYFVSDKIALSASVGVPGIHQPNSSTIGVNFAPNFSYYIPLTSQLYWVLSAGFAYEFGNYKETVPGTGTAEADYTGWQINFTPAALEFRASEKVSIGVSLGSLTHISTSMTANSTTLKVIQNRWKINDLGVSCHIWF